MKLKRGIMSFVAAMFLFTIVNTANVLAEEISENNATEWETTESIQMTGNDDEQTSETEVECAHDYTSEITKEPTCLQEGERTFTCRKCEEQYKESIPATGHNVVKDTAVAATCTREGLTEGSHCSACGMRIVAQNQTPATGHNVVKDTAVAATCTRTGKTEGSHCSVCGKILIAQETTPVGAHKYKTTIKKATTSKNGSVTKKCTVCGKTDKAGTYTVYKPKTLKLSNTSVVYTGKAIKPSVTVKDSKGKQINKSNYTVSYKNNKNVGIATVVVTFKGKYYSGKLSKTFTITPKNTDGVWVQNWGKGKTITLAWIKQTKQTTGYQIQYATKSNFKNAKTVWVKQVKTTRKEITGLSDNTKYYVRIRTYKTVKVNGKSKNIYSAWSSKVSDRTVKKPVLNTNPVASIWAGPYELYVLYLDDRGYPYYYGKWGGSANMDADHYARTEACSKEIVRYMQELAIYNGEYSISTSNGVTTTTFSKMTSITWEYIGIYDGISVVRRYVE